MSLNNHIVKKSLDDIHKKFVVAPIDKANGNVSFICKRFYIDVLIKELGINNINNENDITTYKEHNTSDLQIINKHSNVLHKKFNLSVNQENKILPTIYWIPKLHKNPSKARFIIASPISSIKPLTKTVTSVFKLMFNQIQRYNYKCRYFSGVNSFWTVLNNEPVIREIDKLNKRSKAETITTFDFSTLYTKITHDKLLKVLNELTDFCFDGGLGNFIVVNKYSASWASSKPDADQCVVFDKKLFKQAIKYIMDNCFFKFGNKVFQQTIGIPMGSDPAPFMANLFLYYYEEKWIRKTKRKDLIMARKFGNVFRFIDDLAAINDSGEFEKIFREIYPPELELKRENISSTEASFLDLHIKIDNNKFALSLYDKRDNFPFSIVRMPYASSNIPSKVFYSSLGAEILRIGRTTSNRDGFRMSSQKIIGRMMKQGGIKNKIHQCLCKIYGRHFEVFRSFSDTCTDFLDLLLS